MLFTLCTSLPAAIPLSVLSSLSMVSSHHTPQWVPSCTLCVEGMLHILLVLGAPGLHNSSWVQALQMGPHKGRIGGDNPRMPLAFQAAGARSVFVHQCHHSIIEGHQMSSSSSLYTYLGLLYTVYISGPTQEQDLALGFVESHYIHTEPTFQVCPGPSEKHFFLLLCQLNHSAQCH